MIELKPAGELDMGTLADLFTAAYEGYWFPVDLDEAAFARMAEVADVDLGLSRVALADGTPAAIALVARREATGWIGGMGVLAAYRRRGLGRATLVAALDAAREAGIARMTLEVLEQNVAARTLYEQLGFEVVRELEVWSLPTGPGEPSVVDPEAAQAWLRAHRTLSEPWQRDDRSIERLGDVTGLLVDGAAALARVAGGRVGVLQLDGRREPLRRLLAGARTLGESLTVVNLPSAHPASAILAELGGRVDARQHEMALSLVRRPDGDASG